MLRLSETIFIFHEFIFENVVISDLFAMAKCTYLLTYLLILGLNTEIYGVKSVQMRSFSWSVFFCILTENGDLWSQLQLTTEYDVEY